jgi:hypothetical protein
MFLLQKYITKIYYKKYITKGVGVNLNLIRVISNI